MCRLTRAFAADKHNISFNHRVIGIQFVGVTIGAKNDNCNRIDIAGSTIAIVLSQLLTTIIAILMFETFMLVSN